MSLGQITLTVVTDQLHAFEDSKVPPLLQGPRDPTRQLPLVTNSDPGVDLSAGKRRGLGLGLRNMPPTTRWIELLEKWK